MGNKNTTIDGLAMMVKRGFDATDKKIENGFKGVNVRLEKIENFILKQHSQKIKSLEGRIHRLEESLAIK